MVILEAMAATSSPVRPLGAWDGWHRLRWRGLGPRASVAKVRLVVIRLERHDERAPRLLALAGPGVVAYSVVLPLVTVGLVAESWGHGYGDAGWALAATAVYLPIHVGHVRRALRGDRSVGGPLGLAVMALAIAAVLPVVGPPWLAVLGSLVVSALLVLRPPWSAVLAGAVVVGTVPLAMALAADGASLGDAATMAHWYTSVVVFRASSLFVLVWLLVSLGRLQRARAALAADAVLHERLRIDEELRATVGAELESIAATGGRIATADVEVGATLEPQALRAELQALVDSARRTLAQARRLSNGYQRPSLDAELDLAVSLLRAAGIDASVDRPVGGLPVVADASRQAALAAELRARTAAVLRDEAVRRCVITVTAGGGGDGTTGVRLEVRTDGVPLLTGRAGADR